MSLDVSLTEMRPTDVYSSNITHNLAKMAQEVKFEWNNATYTLYSVLWHADSLGLTKASEIAELLDLGWNVLLADPVKFQEFNPANGWGNYDTLCNFVYQYRNACWDNPRAALRISR